MQLTNTQIETIIYDNLEQIHQYITDIYGWELDEFEEDDNVYNMVSVMPEELTENMNAYELNVWRNTVCEFIREQY